MQESYDVVIIGTGLAESMLAGALSRSGKSVLHLDSADCYGGIYSTLGLNQLIEAANGDVVVDSTDDEANESIDALQEHLHSDPVLTSRLASLLNVSQPSLTDSQWLRVNSKRVSFLFSAINRSKAFNIELQPLLLYGSGSVIELLVRTHAAPFVEFKLVEALRFEWLQNVENVPGTKEDVFASKFISLANKRRLMKVLTLCLTHNKQLDQSTDVSFAEFLDKCGLDEKLSSVITHAIGFIDQPATEISTDTGLRCTQMHLKSIGRYGKAAMLVGIYGTGSELCQAFCRYCAVYGGIYMLGFNLDEIVLNDTGVTVTGNGATFIAKKLIVGSQYANRVPLNLKVKQETHWKAVVVSEAPLISSDLAGMVVFPPQKGVRSHTLYAIQYNESTGSCISGTYVTCLVSESELTTKKDLENAYNILNPASSRINCLVAYIPIKIQRVETESAWVHQDVAVCPSPTHALHNESCVDTARDLFLSICPNDPFYPDATESIEPEDE